MLTQEAVSSAVYAAVADLNESLPDDHKIPLAGSTDVLSLVDSLGALNLVLRIEQRLSETAVADCDLVGSDLYETTLFRSPSLDDLAAGVFAALTEAR
jgi:hypothetical protein